IVFLFSSRRRHTRSSRDWSSDVCSSDLAETIHAAAQRVERAVDHGHACAHAQGDHRRVAADRAGTQYDDVSRFHAGHAAEQHARSEERRVGKEWSEQGIPYTGIEMNW